MAGHARNRKPSHKTLNLFSNPEELIRFARKHSPFYKSLYKNLPETIRLKDLPILPIDEFWKACDFPNNQVATGPVKDGLIWRSGGTTGSPKTTLYTSEEWLLQVKRSAEGFAKGSLRNGDRIINLFCHGSLNGSYMFTTMCFLECPLELTQLPASGSPNFSDMVSAVNTFKGNTIIGVPTLIMIFVEQVALNPGLMDTSLIKKILYAGEVFHQDQLDKLKKTFPNVQITSLGYASNDAGIIGYADETCEIGEHRVYDGHSIVEIIDPISGQAIEEPNKEGLIVITNLTRKFIPLIRYPVGDLGKWTEPTRTLNRKFKILGRSEDAARVGFIKFYSTDVRNTLQSFKEISFVDFQMIIRVENGIEGLTLRIATDTDFKIVKKYEQTIIDKLISERKRYTEYMKFNKLLPIQIQWVRFQDLEFSPRTSKLLRVIDKRKL